jgi:predicted ATPase with chaperone activity
MVRVWGVAEDRLIEIRAKPPAVSGLGTRIEGLPEDRCRTTADRVRAALVNSGVVQDAPPMVIRLEPAVRSGRTDELDVALALAVLASIGEVGEGLGWILGTGRLGLDGSVWAPGLADPCGLEGVVNSVRGLV